jgi:hypothetical protein
MVLGEDAREDIEHLLVAPDVDLADEAEVEHELEAVDAVGRPSERVAVRGEERRVRGVTLRSQKRARSLPFSTVLYIAR